MPTQPPKKELPRWALSSQLVDVKRRAFVQRSLLGSSAFAATGLSTRLLAQPTGETDLIYTHTGDPGLELYIPPESRPFQSGDAVYFGIFHAFQEGETQKYYSQEKSFHIESVTDAGIREIPISDSAGPARYRVIQVRCDQGEPHRSPRPSHYEETDSLWSIRLPLVFNFLEAHGEADSGNTYVRLARGREADGDMDVVTLYRKYGRFHEQTSSDESCFVTTACLRQLGKSDNCHELNALRRLRDHYVAQEVADGKDWIELYSYLGPALVRHFRHHPQCSSKYDQIYRDLIVKSVQLVDKNRLGEAFHHYRDTLIAIAKREGF